jgi:hypothetical protein
MMRARPLVQVMRRGRRVRWGLAWAAGVLGLVLAAAVPASAKGPQSLSISGPGLTSPIELSSDSNPEELSEIDTGMWLAMPGATDPALLADAPTGDLGSRYTLTWQLMGGPGGETSPIRQDLYLDAAGGPLAYTPAGQPIWDGVTRSGWYRAPERVRDMLASAGVPVAGGSRDEVSASPRTVSATPASRDAAAGRGSGDPAWPEAIIGLTAALAAAGVGGVLAVRRTRRRRPGGRMATS